MTVSRSPFNRVLGEVPPSLQRPVRFLGTGVLNTAFGYGVFALAIWQGAAPQMALILQFGLGILWNYMTHAKLVFAVRGVTRLPLYALAYGMIYLANVALLAGLMKLGLNAYLAQALALPVIVVLSFVMVAKALGAPITARGEGAG
ncbi:GtrA family protein [Cognatishimia sp. MH4019]|uniref:GtrA family protein n=1 Tax=Cognatishimia sp. MH4019 TaxID=2854030 RepID=UPI001CD3A680|nr:GtrA family protein [Cognatishimia sp. MH4019]